MTMKNKDIFVLLLPFDYDFKKNYILDDGIQKYLVLKNYDRENKYKLKAWKEILKKLNVKSKTGILVKLINNEK